MEHVRKCPICGRVYETYTHMVGDQSVCGGCRAEARDAVARPSSPDEIYRRRNYFKNHQ